MKWSHHEIWLKCWKSAIMATFRTCSQVHRELWPLRLPRGRGQKFRTHYTQPPFPKTLATPLFAVSGEILKLLNLTLYWSIHAYIYQIDRSHGRASNEGAPPPHIMPTSSSSSSPLSSTQTDAHSLRHLGARKKFNLSEIGVGGGISVGVSGAMGSGASTEGVAVSGGSHMRISGSGSSISGGALVGGVSTPVKEREQSSLVSL